MSRPRRALALLWLAAGAARADGHAVLAVGEPPGGPGPEVAAQAERVREALRERGLRVIGGAELAASLGGPPAPADAARLERAYATALAAFEHDRFARSAAQLRALLDELERLPESPELYVHWVRAVERLAYVERVLGRGAAAAALLERLAATDPSHAIDPVQYPPSLRGAFELARARVGARPRARLTVTAGGARAQVFVNGRPMGPAPAALELPLGRYRVGAASPAGRAPSVALELIEDRAVALDVALAEAVRPGPALAAPAGERAALAARAGRAAGAERLVVLTPCAEGGRCLAGALFELERGAPLREARVRAADPAALAALAAYLTAGEASPLVTPSAPPAPAAVAAAAASGPSPPRRPDLSPLAAASAAKPAALPPLLAPRPSAGPERGPPHAWMRPTAWAAAGVAAGLAGVTLWQGLAAGGRYGDAQAMLRTDGTFVPGADPASYQRAVAAGDSAKLNAYLAAGGAVLFAVAAGVFGYLSSDGDGDGDGGGDGDGDGTGAGRASRWR